MCMPRAVLVCNFLDQIFLDFLKKNYTEPLDPEILPINLMLALGGPFSRFSNVCWI